MQRTSRNHEQRRTLLAICAGVVVAGVMLFVLADWVMGIPYRRAESKLSVGLSAAEVRERFGEPYRVHHAASAPEDYYLEGWARRERSITSVVWIFIVGEPVCYVWFDEDGKVEDWFIGGS